MKNTYQHKAFVAVMIIGLLPSIGIFIWGVHRALQTKAETIVPVFSTMK